MERNSRHYQRLVPLNVGLNLSSLISWTLTVKIRLSVHLATVRASDWRFPRQLVRYKLNYYQAYY